MPKEIMISADRTHDATATGELWFLVSHSSAGGAQELWVNLAETFRDRGHFVRLMALYPLRETVRVTHDIPWDYVLPQRPASPIASLRLFRTLVSRIVQERPAVIFTALPAANVMAALAVRVSGVPTRVVTSHHSPASTYNRWLDRADGFSGSLGSVSAIVSVSDSVAGSLAAKPATYLAKRRTIHNALPPRIETLSSALAKQRSQEHHPGRLVVATGRLAPQKNYPLLLRASRLMSDVEIEIVGNGPDEAALTSLAAELGVAERVTFLGHRPREEALEILAHGDVFVQVSLFEGHSLALIEAAKLGIPIVVSDVPVQIEGITAADGTRCGIAVGAQDDAGLAREICRLLGDRAHYDHFAGLARKLGREATYDAMIDAYARLAA